MPPFTIWPIRYENANQWVFCRPTGEPIGPDHYRTPELAAEAATALAKERGKESSVIYESGRITGVRVDEGQYPSQSRQSVALTLEVAPDFVGFLDKLAAEMGVDREEAVRLSLGLMRIAQDAKRQGNGLAIVTPALEIDQEIDVD